MLFKFFLLASAVLSTAFAGSDVLVFTDADFEDRIGAYETALVEFYAPWCGHCKQLAPQYDMAATYLQATETVVPLIKIDCTVEKNTCAKYGVSGYPTLKIFKNGEFWADYEGPRDADGIVKYMLNKAGPSSKELTTVEEMEKYLNNTEHSIVGFFKSADASLAVEFKKAAEKLSESYRLAYSTNPAVLSKYNPDGKDKIVIFQPPRLQVKLEPTQKVYMGAADAEKLKQFIADEYHGLVGHRTTANMVNDFKKRPLIVVLYNVDYKKDVKGTNYIRNRVIKVAKKLKQDEKLDINFAISNSFDFKSTELAEYGIDDVNINSKLMIARGKNNEKYKFQGEFSPENLEKFARDLLAGNLEQHLKSEPIPEESTDAVRTVVAKNFDQVVNDKTKDVLIEFYAPWCGHCKSLAPKYEQLAQKLIKSERDIVIAKMDATANDVPPQYEVTGFPTIYFVPKNSKSSPKIYQGGREVDDFITYLAKESTNPLNGYDRKGKKVAKKSDL